MNEGAQTVDLEKREGTKNVQLRRIFNDMAILSGGLKLNKIRFRLPEYEIAPDNEETRYTTWRHVNTRGYRIQNVEVENPTVTLQPLSSNGEESSAAPTTYRILMDMFTTPRLQQKKQTLIPVVFIGDEVRINGERYKVTGGTAAIQYNHNKLPNKNDITKIKGRRGVKRLPLWVNSRHSILFQDVAKNFIEYWTNQFPNVQQYPSSIPDKIIRMRLKTYNGDYKEIYQN